MFVNVATRYQNVVKRPIQTGASSGELVRQNSVQDCASVIWRSVYDSFKRKCRDGKIRTFHRTLHSSMYWTLYYCYKDNFAWFPNANPHW